MKKSTNLLALLAIVVFLCASCSGAKSCPAYSKTVKPATEKNA